MATRVELHRQETRARLITAARTPLGSGGGVTAQLIEDLSRQVGVHPHSFRTLFPHDDDLLDAVNKELVDQCEQRLRSGIAAFVRGLEPGMSSADALHAASVALADARPIDRDGVLLRAERRARVLQQNADGSAVITAERQFSLVLVSVLTELMTGLGRRFSWPPILAVRVIIETYERSFENWLIGGGDELDFSSSAYVCRTLPTLLDELSEATPST